MRRKRGRGDKKRKCTVCGALVFYASRPAWALTVKNRRDADVLVTVDRDDTLCDGCVRHNGVESQVQWLPVARDRKPCPVCEGKGVRPDPLALRWSCSGNVGGRVGLAKAGTSRCGTCRGQGSVAR